MIETTKISLPRLYHGSSTLYLSRFRVGSSHQEWSDRGVAFALLEAVREAAAHLDVSLKFYERGILEQRSRSANWQHGCLYATPSLHKAIEYAVPNAARGGELLTILRNVVDRIAQSNRETAEKIEQLARNLGLGHFVDGCAQPIIVVLDALTSGDVTTENGASADQQVRRLNELQNRPHYQAICQQMNFRVRPHAGTITDIGNVTIEDAGAFTVRWRT